MASSSLNTKTLSFTAFLLLLLSLLCSAAPAADAVKRELKPRKEKTTHLRFYVQNTVSGPHPYGERVVNGSTSTVKSLNSSSVPFLTFGDVVVFDDPMTEGPDPSSRIVGRAQGLYALASRGELSVLLLENLVFEGGEHGGSSIAVHAWIPYARKAGEYSVVGGSGHFLLARGYILGEAYVSNLTSGDSVHEYNVYISHY